MAKRPTKPSITPNGIESGVHTGGGGSSKAGTLPPIIAPPSPLWWRGVQRVRDWYDLYIDDHGFLRFGWHNQHQFAPAAWRSNQPTPWRIAKAARMGIATIINLRGKRDHGSWRLEKEACEKHRLTMIDFTISSRAVPNYDTIRAADNLFAEVRHPILLHCKSGADRVGVMAALYLLLYADSSIDTAAKQLALKYLHLKHGRTGLLDAFLDAYRPFAAQGMQFRHWARHHLDPDAITYHFHSRYWSNVLVDVVLRRE